MVNVGTIPEVLALGRQPVSGAGRSDSTDDLEGWGGGLVVVAGVTTRHGDRESRSQGEGGQQVSSRREWNVRRCVAGEYPSEPQQVLYEAQARVLRIQTKLHRWARDDPHRRFDDLYNLVCDPAFLVVAWDRVRGNKGARTAGWTAVRPSR